jgi:hypothetical protein
MKTLVRTVMVAMFSSGLVYLLWQQERRQRVVKPTTIRNDTAERLRAAMAQHDANLEGLANTVDDFVVGMGKSHLARDPLSAKIRASIERKKAQ